MQCYTYPSNSLGERLSLFSQAYLRIGLRSIGFPYEDEPKLFNIYIAGLLKRLCD
jgi:hypothetical protein